MGKFLWCLYGMHFWEKEGVFFCFSLFLLACVGFVLILVKSGGREKSALTSELKFSCCPSHACLQLRSWIWRKHPSDKIPSCCCAIVTVNFMNPIFNRIPRFCIVILLFVKCVGLFHSFLFFSSFSRWRILLSLTCSFIM